VDATDWQRVRTIFSAAVSLPESERHAYCARATSDDPEICRLVLELLAADRPATLDRPYLAKVPRSDLAEPDENLVGTTLGNYHCERLVWTGFVSSIYLGRRIDGLLRRDVAIKHMRSDARNVEASRRFTNELDLLASIDHHRICRIYDVVLTDSGSRCAILEWIPGMSIDNACDADRLSLRERVLILVSALEALSYLHESGFVHGDVKPEHFQVTGKRWVKLIDFGLARAIGQPADNATFGFTPEFASPEHLRGGVLDVRSDLYSFGVLMYKVLVGRYPVPLKGRLIHQLSDAVLNIEPGIPAKILHQEAPESDSGEMYPDVRTPQEIAKTRSTSVQTLEQALSSDLELILLRSVQKDPKDRYQGADELAVDLRSWMSQKPTIAAVHRSTLLRKDVNMQVGPIRVFLCHCSEDKAAVRDLYSKLRDSGARPWLDEEELLPGQEWKEEIPKAVQDSDVVIVCLSEHSLTKKGYVQREIRFALDVADEQPPGTIFVIPVRLRDCDVPDRLKKWQWVNLYESGGYQRLAKALTLRSAGNQSRK
jgi:serine/threonine protein kinase